MCRNKKNIYIFIYISMMGGQAIVSEYFFEGTEKLLEVWFECSRENDRADLRIIDR